MKSETSMKRTISLLCISSAAFICVGCGQVESPAPDAEPAPPAELAVGDGDSEAAEAAEPDESADSVGSAGTHQAIDVTEADFAQKVLASDQPVMVDFWASWCPPCVALAPTVEEIAAEYAGRAKVAKVNVDEAQGLATEYEISAIPTLLFFHDGAVIERVVGPESKRQLTQKLDAMLSRK
jgi:thioredoxin 1